MGDSMSFSINRESSDGRYTLVIEDDGRVAYAYLQEGNGIVSDVWLYNRCEPPAEPEWRDRTKMPFANPLGFGSENDLGPIESEADVNVRWEGTTAQIEIHGLLWAILQSGDKPGRCRLALKNGPLAKLLDEAS